MLAWLGLLASRVTAQLQHTTYLQPLPCFATAAVAVCICTCSPPVSTSPTHPPCTTTPAGKSTLLNLISGNLQPVKGHISRNPKVRMATFSQHHVDGLDLALTPLQLMMKSYAGLKEPEARSHLSSFGVAAELAGQPMYTLSGGQKSRVAFAKLTFTKPHILLLDEPSNHLDIDAVDALIEGLATFKGGVLMVSHDQFLIESTVDELWMCEDGSITPFHGSFEEYKKRLRSMGKM